MAMETRSVTIKYRVWGRVFLPLRFRSPKNANKMLTGHSDSSTVLMLSFWNPNTNWDTVLKRLTVVGTAKSGSWLPAWPKCSTYQPHGKNIPHTIIAEAIKRLNDPSGNI